ncbi:helix-turn-helix transcriptional regulator [Phyllobacterium sp. LjRoot231]|uniref:winged helix-turn-helix transcriptional regulator n=1 Tax=Phyllobacterium sp. LjRoot231 TaxID=3342289 RepID=UPI003ECCAB77
MHSHAPREKEPCFEQCPVLIRETLDLIAAKWTVPIFFALQSASGPVRYAELQRRLGDITPKELAKHLRNFETAGLVERTVHPTVPPRVEYALTELGESLLPSLQTLADWAIRFGAVVAENKMSNERSAPVRLIKAAGIK